MKNLKKILLSMMVLLLAFAFIGCPAEPDPVKPEEPPAVTNNFKGNVFVAEYSVESASGIWGYIEFIDDTNAKMGIVVYEDENPKIAEQPFTYSVTDDVATLKATMDGEEFTVTTSKLTDGRFTFSTEGVDTETGETYSVLMTCTKGDKSLFDVWTISYPAKDYEEKALAFMLLEYYKYYELVDADYTKNDAEKTITLTESGWEKVKPADPVPEPPVNNFMGKTFLGMTGEGEEAYFASYIIFTSDTNCEVMLFDEEPMPATYTVADDVATLTGTGEYATIQLSTTELTDDGTFEITIPAAVSQQENDIVVRYAVGTLWTILYKDSDDYFSLKIPEEELEYYVGIYGFDEADYNRDNAAKTITLTESGWEKVKPADPAPVPPEPEDDEWTVVYGENVRTFESFAVADAFLSELVGDDYTVDPETYTITLTETSWEIVKDDYAVLDPYGQFLMTFANLDAATEYAGEISLDLSTDCTMDYVNQIIKLTDSGWTKVKNAMGGV